MDPIIPITREKDRAAFEAYREAARRLDKEMSEKRFHLVLVKGVPIWEEEEEKTKDTHEM
jgi:hypothetical protein